VQAHRGFDRISVLNWRRLQVAGLRGGPQNGEPPSSRQAAASSPPAMRAPGRVQAGVISQG
jgi:hypothetical protein